MPACSETIQKYFDELQAKTNTIYEIATKARAKGHDPERVVDIPLASTVAQRVEALISSVASQLRGSGVAQRIVDLEKKHGPGDWRVALVVSRDVAQEKFCKFKDVREAIEVGIRVGFAYVTLGVVSAPLEGLVEIKLKKRKDGKEYLAMYFAGPIRGAGGTASAVSIIIADYVRRVFPIYDYDITDEEVKRYIVEIDDYCTKVAHRQYVPGPEELTLFMKNVGIEITGDPTEKYEVSQCKHLERVETDMIRGGMALVITEGPTLKAEKVWKQLSKWGKDFELERWNFMKDFIELKTRLHSAGAKTDEKIKPIDSYLRDLVAGRPVFSYPLQPGGFRLRYGRSRLTGFASTAISPLTMQLLGGYVATGTQIKTERPGKATVFTPCDTLEAPIVKLKDGSVIRLETEKEARQLSDKIEKILFLGDILISFGDFSENGQRLVPSGYVEEWWIQDARKALASAEMPADVKETLQKLIENPKLSAKEAIELSEKLKIPLHPRHTYFFKEVIPAELCALFAWLARNPELEKQFDKEAKLILEKLSCPHKVLDGKLVFSQDDMDILNYILSQYTASAARFAPAQPEMSAIDFINSFSNVKVRDKAGTYIGSRMGRPEKAKIRKLKGSPVGLFPVGKEGGRLRSFQAVLEAGGTITSDFPIFECETCRATTIYPVCEVCNNKTIKMRLCPLCKKRTTNEKCHTETQGYERRKVNISHYLTAAMKKVGMEQIPTLIKGVKGTWNKDHILEDFAKALLRAKHGITVNKDGTIRYDMTELGGTHFKVSEIGVTVEQIKKLGYLFDKDGLPMENESQIFEMRPQDVVIPCSAGSGDEPADAILIRISNFVDELLEKFYGLPKYYNAKKREDLLGHIVIGLAPHTSGGIVGRVIGFSKTQGCFAHPYWHAAQRRNFDGDETCIILALDAFLNFSRQFLPDRRGAKTMDAPLVLTTVLDPTEVDTEAHGIDVAGQYPIEFYEATQKYAWPWESPVEQVKSRLGKPAQYEGLKYTHEVSDMNEGVLVSAYKSIPTMLEKLEGQMDLTLKLRGVRFDHVARLVIDKHFIRDIKGNLRNFTGQEYRCVACNAKYRRIPLSGVCFDCKGGKLVYTIAEGTIKKYLDASMKLSKYCPPYMQQTMELLSRRIESIFGRDLTKQIELKSWFGT
ncbi:MAG: DNA polymerase II large subunit [Nanoarchaeota archaeon]